MNTLGGLLSVVLLLSQILRWAIIIYAVMSWLVAFNVVNLHSPFVRAVIETLDRILNPLLRPIRRVMPDLGGIDLSPMVLWLLLLLFERLVSGMYRDMFMATV
jgi:YggT family protein